MNKPANRPQLTTLQKVSESSEVRSAIDRDFGSAIEDLNDGVSRRRWLQLMGASLALGGMSGCRYEKEQIAPFAFRPQNRVPGIPEKYSATIDFAGVAQPLVATSFDGRPIKLDGNPDHPAAKGSSTTFTQATILNLYDPDRLRDPLRATGDTFEDVDWNEILNAGRGLLAGDTSSVAIVSEQVGSPSLARLKQQLIDKGVNWFTFSAINDDNAREGARQAFGKPVRMHCDFEKAKVIVSIDADPLGMHPDAVNNTIKFTAGRDADHGVMSRMYAIESQFSVTGSSADHRISVRSSQIPGFVGSLRQAVDAAEPAAAIDESLAYRDKMLACMAQDLRDHAGECVVVCGERQPPEVHAAVHALNEDLGNIGKTVTFTTVAGADEPGSLDSIKQFADKARAGEIKSVVLLGGNPVFNAPRSLGLAEVISGMANSLHITSHRNETSLCCKLICDVAHQLESWSDGWAYDGSVCIGQPLILPLFGSRSETEILSEFLGNEIVASQEIVQATQNLDAKTWAKSVHDGFVTDSQPEPEPVSVGEVAPLAADDGWKTPWDGSVYEIVFQPSRNLYDGRFANNAWMQELPDFITKLTWGNSAQVSPNTAEKLKVRTGQTINLGNIGLPVIVQPGQADGSIGLTLGYGRTEVGAVGGNVRTGEIVGVDVVPLRTMENWNFGGIERVNPTRDFERLARVQENWDIDETGRNEIQARMFRDP